MKINTSRNQEALVKFLMFTAYLTYLAAVAYGDVMFIMLVGDIFPDGILGVFAIIGAVVTAISAALLIPAFIWWFSPGIQQVAAFTFWLIEGAVLIGNIILATRIAHGQVLDGALMTWQYFSPATPVISFLGWGMIFKLDESAKMANSLREGMADAIDAWGKAYKSAINSDEFKASAENSAAEMSQAISAAFKEMSSQARGKMQITGAPVWENPAPKPTRNGSKPEMVAYQAETVLMDEHPNG